MIVTGMLTNEKGVDSRTPVEIYKAPNGIYETHSSDFDPDLRWVVYGDFILMFKKGEFDYIFKKLNCGSRLVVPLTNVKATISFSS